LKHQKNNFQHELTPNKDKSLKVSYAPNSQRFYSVSAENTQYSPRNGGSCSAGLQSKHLSKTSQAYTLSPKSIDRQKEGVDRAYPLKPISHHNSASVPMVNTAQLGSSPYIQDAPNRKSRSISKEKAPAGRSQLAAVHCPWTVEPESSAFLLYRRELDYILKLEADGRNLEDAIQKKEALLKEKLRRTKETLWRIQREKELIKAEERRDSEVEMTHERKAARHPEEKTVRVAVRPGGGVFSGAQSAETIIPKPGTTLHPQELSVGKLKKEQLVTNNSKMQDDIPMDCLGSCSKLTPKHSPSPSALSDQESGDHLSAEMLYMQAGIAVEQERLGQCSFCKRKFLCTRLEKHMSICGENQVSKRKVFDSSKARARGTELEQYQQWKNSRSAQSETPPRRNNWKQKHEALIQTVCQARQLQQLLAKGGKVSDLPPLPPMENPDYVACTYCGRQFAPRAAERHIPKCKTIKNKPPPPPHRRR
ncbi:ZC21C protein, partial [Campylorhamphus procurvoides]|nr:ZC21C protein [Campylorhamphus procurvoides]